jgi:hypothetical protein
VRTWSVAGLILTLVGLPLFALPTVLHSGSAEFRVDLASVFLVVVLCVVLMLLHEAVHGAAMLLFGARPTFGATLVARSMPALYATAPGHRFTRLQYLAVSLTPAVLISGLGLPLTLASWGGYLVLPLAVHLGGCVGDFAATLRLGREPNGTMCEDLRDGIRFYRPA